MVQQNENHYLVLARRTRPQKLQEVMGQPLVQKVLTPILSSKNIPHAFIFAGTRGTGKTSTARIFAKSLCCEKGPTPEPCQECIHCKQITACVHEDVIEIDGASNTGVDQIRELRESARFFPVKANYKIYIIDEVHMLSTGAFNALLKTLEEPPPQVIFILATTEMHKVPITVRSRCACLTFQKISLNDITQHLKNILSKENKSFEEDALLFLAREARGSMRDALSLLEQVIHLIGPQESLTLTQTQQLLSSHSGTLSSQLFQAICTRDIQNSLALVANADAMGVDLGQLLEETAHIFRSALILKSKVAQPQQLELLEAEIQPIQNYSSHLSYAALSACFKTLYEGSTIASKMVYAKNWVEVTILDVLQKTEWLSSDELLASLTKAPAALTTSLPKKEWAPTNNVAAPPVAPSSTPAPMPAVGTKALLEFADVIKVLEKDSIPFAQKIKNAEISQFNNQVLEFASTSHNQLYTTFTDAEFSLLKQALVKLDRGAIQIKNCNVLKNSSGKAGAEADKLKSVAHLQRAQRLQEVKEKESEIRNLESFKSLAQLATSLEFLPSED